MAPSLVLAEKVSAFCKTWEKLNLPTRPPFVLHPSTSEEMDNADGGKSDQPEAAARPTMRSSSSNRELWALGERDKPASQNGSTSSARSIQARSRSLDSSRRDDGRVKEKDIAKETSQAIKAAVPTAAMEPRDSEHDTRSKPPRPRRCFEGIAFRCESHSDAGKNDASHNDADEVQNFQSAPSARLDRGSKSSSVKDTTSGVAQSDIMGEVSLKTQRGHRKGDVPSDQGSSPDRCHGNP